MNIAITEGLVLTPPAFEEGLDVWSSENGTAGSATYDGAANAAIVAADQDFGSCLELTKTVSTQKLRYMGHTPMIPGAYLRISAKVKAISGNLPSVRIAGYAMNASDSHVSGLTEIGTSVTLTEYGTVVEVSAIVGTGARTGVDMIWGTVPIYGFFGLDLTGQNGGVVRIDDIQIDDVTDAFLREMMDWVDVRDFGAKGDGVTDDSAAFAAADAAAAGRWVLVSEGVYYLGSTVSMASQTRFVGTVTMPTASRLSLLQNFDLPTYARAFGDELVGFKRALQALFYYTDHNTLDLCGRRVDIDAPIDIKAIAPDLSSYSSRRVLRNGQLNAIESTAWNDTVVTSQASYSTSSQYQLTGVTNIAQIPVGAQVTGNGVGREVYVKAVNVAAGSLTLSQPFYGGSGNRTLTFTRRKYMLDFSGLSNLDRFNIDDIEFTCNGYASTILLAPSGELFQIRDCYIVRPKDRAITSIGSGCQDLHVDRCHFLSNEMSLAATARTSIAINVNANDAKIRDSRFVRFGTTFIMDGNGHLFGGNHWFQGDGETAGPRTAGLVFCQPNVKSAITGNYIDNSFIEWTNEYSSDPVFSTNYSFGGLTVTGNIFTCNDVASWFTWFSIKPYGAGHFIQGLNISCNTFKSLNGAIDRVEKVDTTFAALDNTRMRNVMIEGNSFNGVSQVISNPVFLQVDQATAQTTWTAQPGPYLAFGGYARNVESLVAEGMITDASGGRINNMPYVLVEQNSSKQDVKINWGTAALGRVHIRVRMDNPN